MVSFLQLAAQNKKQILVQLKVLQSKESGWLMQILHCFEFLPNELAEQNSKSCKICISQHDALECNAFNWKYLLGLINLYLPTEFVTVLCGKKRASQSATTAAKTETGVFFQLLAERKTLLSVQIEKVLALLIYLWQLYVFWL